MGDVIDLSEYHKIAAWVGKDPKTGEFFVIYENETVNEHSVDGPYETEEEAQDSINAWAEQRGAIPGADKKDMQ